MDELKNKLQELKYICQDGTMDDVLEYIEEWIDDIDMNMVMRNNDDLFGDF